ncbi:LysR substrate-binding domain-containing protein [Coralliovum pocilloporae]|uniref:LysR substrate-binding domain-containing protein n=1 Tax=Coralliovum pocilloporae TaxID=3066369 RepID=UPI0033074276
MSDYLPSLSALRAFAATARHGSFSAAGRELNVTHAAVAQQVRALEAHLGLGLVERRGRGVELTALGQSFAHDLNDGFSALSQAVKRVLAQDSVRPVSITMTPSFASDWMMPRLSKFRDAHPDVDLMIHPSTALIDLKTSDHDFAIRFGSGDWPDTASTWLMPTVFVIAGIRDFLPNEEEPLGDQLARYPWLQEVGTEEQQLWLRQQGLEAADGARVTHLPGYMVLSALRQGQGIAATARLFIEDDIKAGHLHILWENDSHNSGYYLVQAQSRLRPSAQTVADWLHQEAQDSAGSAGS